MGAAAFFRSRKEQKMSEFNHFAKELDAAFRTARSEYAAVYDELTKAKESASAAGLDAVKKQIATLQLQEAEKKMRQETARIWAEFDAKAAELRRALEKEVQTSHLADPSAIDSNAVELMKTGVLSPADYSAFMERFDSNHTMLKLVGHYAAEAAKTTDSRREATALNAIALDCQSGEGAVMRAWDGISAISDSCGDGDGYRRKSPGVIVSMSEKWDDLAGEAVENF